MGVIFTSNVSKKGRRIVKAARGRVCSHEADHFVYSQYHQHLSSQGESTFQNVTWFSSYSFFNEWIIS